MQNLSGHAKMRKKFQRDLYDEFRLPDTEERIYPKWVINLSFQMVSLGWKKEDKED